MDAPCRGCKYEHESKSLPFLWNKDSPIKTMPKNLVIHIPGLNYPNPCYGCKDAMEYDQWVIDYYDLPPVTGRTGVVENLDIIPDNYFEEFEEYETPTKSFNI